MSLAKDGFLNQENWMKFTDILKIQNYSSSAEITNHDLNKHLEDLRDFKNN